MSERCLDWAPDPGMYRQYHSTLGATLVFLPISSPHLVEVKQGTLPRECEPSSELRAWLDQYVGPRGSYIRQLFRGPRYCPVCYTRASKMVTDKNGRRINVQTGYNFYFNQVRKAVLFKLTWGGDD